MFFIHMKELEKNQNDRSYLKVPHVTCISLKFWNLNHACIVRTAYFVISEITNRRK